MVTDICLCDHQKDQHALLKHECDNCECKKFIDKSEAVIADDSLDGAMCTVPDSVIADKDRGSAIIVGTEWHEFNGDQLLCQGILGNSVGAKCSKPYDNPIHSEDRKPQWMKDTEVPNSGLKDSGKRKEFASGMIRDTAEDKPRFDLVVPLGIPYDQLMLTRWAELLRKGAIKYAERNWEKATGDEELNHAKASAFRHFMQWISGETDEDHAAAVFFNINEVETIKWKQTNQKKEV